MGADVNRCGTAKELFAYCYNIAKIQKNTMAEYKEEYEKDGHCGWLIMIQQKKKELQMHINFAKFLKTL